MKKFIYTLKLRYYSKWLCCHWRDSDGEKFEIYFNLWLKYAKLLGIEPEKM